MKNLKLEVYLVHLLSIQQSEFNPLKIDRVQPNFSQTANYTG